MSNDGMLFSKLGTLAHEQYIGNKKLLHLLNSGACFVHYTVTDDLTGDLIVSCCTKTIGSSN
jgi:hypothetical protein